MTPTTKGVSALRQRMIDDMRMRKLSDKTHHSHANLPIRAIAFLLFSP